MAPSRPTYESNSDSCSYSLDFGAPRDSGDALRSLCAQVVASAATLAQGYIWHKQGFNLQLSPLSFAATATATQHQFLQGTTEVTDAVDDEWLLVWILRCISQQYTDAVIHIDDDDGEFLLIEAADHLPTWLTPQNAENRVWIHRGRLHLVPLEHKSALPFEDKSLNPSFDPDDQGFLDRAAAIELVRDASVDTLAPKEVEDAVWARIDGYPGKMEEHHHRTLAYLPTDIALALSDSPSLIAEAVGAFYEREPATLRAVNAMSRFPPAPPLAPAPSSGMADPTLPGTVLVPTLLTRPLCSQLVLQRFYAPKPFEKAGWVDGVRDKDDERRRSIGMKIACGFEMLYKQTSPLPRQSSTSDLDAVDTTSTAYRAYLSSLREQAYFGEAIEGSERWSAREREAREGWAKALASRPKSPFAQRVDEAIARARSSASPLASRVTDPATIQAQELEDSEEWMALDEQGLEDILAAKGGNGGGGAGMLGDSDLEESDDEASDAEDEGEGGGRGEGMEGVEGARERAEDKKAKKVARRLEEMAGKVEEFVQGRGAASGALFEDERDLDDAEDSEDEDAEMPELNAEERAARMEKLVAALPAEQWGQKDPSATAAAPPPLETDAAVSTREPRAPKLTKEVYEGASDLEDESDSENEAMPEGEEGLGGEEVEGEDGPSVVNEEDVLDLGEEMDEFLKFATETLGLTEAQYEKILSDRRGRGAFVPGPAKEKKTNVLPSGKKAPSPSAAPPKPSPAAATAAGNPPPLREPLRNPNLTDFDALMEQMENELARAKGGRAAPPAAPPVDDDDGPAPTGKYASRQSRDPHRVGVVSLSDSDDDGAGSDDDLAAMDSELAGLLQGMTGAATDAPMDYNLVKNFLDSFQSQGGFAGPAGNLAGRLGFPLPRDAEGEQRGAQR